MTRISINIASRNESYDVVVEKGSFHLAGETIRRAVGRGPGRAAIISNSRVFSIYGERLESSLQRSNFLPAVHLIGDGERFKNLRTLERSIDFLSKSGIKRDDVIIALGGGVVGDVGGLAASLHLRGVPFFYIPTSLLAMIDASVGGKTGINSKHGKNLIGTIRQPAGVLIDASLLVTLPRRHIRAGLYESIKHGALSGKRLLKTNFRLVDDLSDIQFEPENTDVIDQISACIAENVAFKASIVCGDAYESPHRSWSRSRKILNFGHTFAHALEKALGYRGILHGEAVGWGILLAAELSKKLANLPESDVTLLNDVVRRVGGLPAINNIDPENVLRSLDLDKKVIGGTLQMVLLSRIGRPVIFSIGEDKLSHLRTATRKILQESC